MIRIRIPNNNINERHYIIDVLFGEFLGLEYTIGTGSTDYEIILPNQQKLIIEDTFFNKYPKDLEYLKLENVPKSIKKFDLFSASFFMLTRWEEYVNKIRDKHNRFPANESLAYQEGFLDKPIVDQYVDRLKQMLYAKDDTLVFPFKKYHLVVTHDVDHIYKWKKIRGVIRSLVGDLVIRKSLKSFFSTFGYMLLWIFGMRKDPYDTFEWLLSQNEGANRESVFYFMSGGTSQYDNHYSIEDPSVRSLIKMIQDKGHKIGLHPSYNAYNNKELFQKEKVYLEKVCQCKVTESREHYLRFEVPTTWQICEENGIKVESTCAYAEQTGYRCGTGREYSVFNILTRKKLRLKERPLIVMDVSLLDKSSYEAEQYVKTLLFYAKNNGGTFTILWHNSSVYLQNWKMYRSIYQKVLQS